MKKIMIKKAGFSLIEILIATAISGFVLTALYNVLSQTNKAVTTIERITSTDMRISLLQNQLERDLAGSFIVYERQPKKTDEKTGDKEVDKKGQAGADDKSGQQKGQGDKKQQYQEVVMKNCFYSKNGAENLEILSFITNNPLKTFIRPANLIKRVTYKIERDQDKGKKAGVQEGKVSYRILRKECDMLDFKTAQEAKSISYELIKNIKKISVEYTVAVKPEDKEKKEDGQKGVQGQDGQKPGAKEGDKKSGDEKEKKIEYKKSKVWTESEVKKFKRNRPDLCKFTVELWDDVKRTSRNFEFIVYIYTQEYKQEIKKEQGQSSGKVSGQPDAQGAGKTPSPLDRFFNGGGKNSGAGSGSGGQMSSAQAGGQFGSLGGQNSLVANNSYGPKNSYSGSSAGANGISGQKKSGRKKSIFDAFLN